MINWKHLAKTFMALWVTDPRYQEWLNTKQLKHKVMCVVLFDRAITEEY